MGLDSVRSRDIDSKISLVNLNFTEYLNCRIIKETWVDIKMEVELRLILIIPTSRMISQIVVSQRKLWKY